MECQDPVSTTPDSRLTQVVAVRATVGASLDCAGGGCTCGVNSRGNRKVLELERKVEKLQEILVDNNALIASLKAKNRDTTAQLLEMQLQKLQQTLSEKDSSLAVMELKLKHSASTEDSTERRQLLSQVETLQAERNKLALQFKGKVAERFALMRRDSDEVLGAVAREYQDCNRGQLCEELRSLDLKIGRLKSYIDQLLAVALESNPSMLEGMPRIQQNSGLKIELFNVASLTELLEELHEREENCRSLHFYASQLIQKLTKQAPNLLDSVLLPKWEELRKCAQWTCEPDVSLSQ